MSDPLKWVEVDLSAIAQNLRHVKRRLARSTRLLGVVKADAYGHGAGPVAKRLEVEGIDMLGVLTVDEAVALRSEGIRTPILVMAPPIPQQAAAAVRARVEVTVDSTGLARALSRAAKRPVRVHADIDFGLGRWGIAPKDLPAFWKTLTRLKKIVPTGLSAHLDYVPGRNAVEAEEKLARFEKIAAPFKTAAPGLVRHCANSSVLMDFPERTADMVRVGNLLYGIDRTGSKERLKDPWRFRARLSSLRTVPKGTPIGYASEYLAPRKMTVASVPVGYADGLTMEPAERFIGFGRGFQYWGILRGKKVPFVGRCGISHALLDVSALKRPRVGDIVDLPLRRTAASSRLPRIYKG